MDEIVKFLSENPVQYFATVSCDTKAKVRPFMFLFEKEGKLWYGTNNQKEVYQEMQANPYVEICVSSPAGAWIRLNGKATFENNMAVKEACMEIPLIKQQYSDVSDPTLEVFYLDKAHAVIADMSGNPPKEYTL